jgi:hypothetical protein
MALTLDQLRRALASPPGHLPSLARARVTGAPASISRRRGRTGGGQGSAWGIS